MPGAEGQQQTGKKRLEFTGYKITSKINGIEYKLKDGEIKSDGSYYDVEVTAQPGSPPIEYLSLKLDSLRQSIQEKRTTRYYRAINPTTHEGFLPDGTLEIILPHIRAQSRATFSWTVDSNGMGGEAPAEPLLQETKAVKRTRRQVNGIKSQELPLERPQPSLQETHSPLTQKPKRSRRQENTGQPSTPGHPLDWLNPARLQAEQQHIQQLLQQRKVSSKQGK